MQSAPVTTKVVSSNPVQDKVYSIQHYVIKNVGDLRQVGGFVPVLWFPPPIKLTTRYNRNIVKNGIKPIYGKQSYEEQKHKIKSENNLMLAT